MKIDSQSLNYITNVVNTARLVGIDEVIIEPGKVRAIDEAKTVVVFQDDEVPELSFHSIGLNRISLFLNRLNLVKTQEGFEIDVATDDNNEFARGLLMKAKGTKVDYRCANPRSIHAPKIIKDEMVCDIQITPEAVYLLEKGQSAMGADKVSIISNDKGVMFELADQNGDKFAHTFSDEVQANDSDATFVNRYLIKTLLALFRQNSEGTFSIGRKGILNIKVNGLNVFVLPQVA